MRYNHFDMLPEKAFQPVGKRMTLEGGGAGKAVKSVGKAVGGVGNVAGSAVGSLGGAGQVLGPAIQLASGASPLGVFGSALGSQVLSSMWGNRGGGGNIYGYNPYGGSNSFANWYNPYGGPNFFVKGYNPYGRSNFFADWYNPYGGSNSFANRYIIPRNDPRYNQASASLQGLPALAQGQK